MVTVAGMLDVKSDAKTGMSHSASGLWGRTVQPCAHCGRWAYLAVGKDTCSEKCSRERMKRWQSQQSKTGWMH